MKNFLYVSLVVVLLTGCGGESASNAVSDPNGKRDQPNCAPLSPNTGATCKSQLPPLNEEQKKILFGYIETRASVEAALSDFARQSRSTRDSLSRELYDLLLDSKCIARTASVDEKYSEFVNGATCPVVFEKSKLDTDIDNVINNEEVVSLNSVTPEFSKIGKFITISSNKKTKTVMNQIDKTHLESTSDTVGSFNARAEEFGSIAEVSSANSVVKAEVDDNKINFSYLKIYGLEKVTFEGFVAELQVILLSNGDEGTLEMYVNGEQIDLGGESKEIPLAKLLQKKNLTLGARELLSKATVAVLKNKIKR